MNVFTPGQSLDCPDVSRKNPRYFIESTLHTVYKSKDNLLVTAALQDENKTKLVFLLFSANLLSMNHVENNIKSAGT